jgi:hypothetical protein
MREVLDTLGCSVRLRCSRSRRWFSSNRTLSPLIKQRGAFAPIPRPCFDQRTFHDSGHPRQNFPVQKIRQDTRLQHHTGFDDPIDVLLVFEKPTNGRLCGIKYGSFLSRAAFRIRSNWVQLRLASSACSDN